MLKFILLLTAVRCYSCFDTSAPPPVQFYVVSRGDPLQYEKVEESLSLTLGFNGPRTSSSRPLPTVFLLHGLGGSHNADSNVKISDGLLERGTVNIIVADYEFGVQGPGYDIAARNVDYIGKAIGDFLVISQNDGSIELSTTTLIGFSLGAHVAGVAGFWIKENYSAYLQKIIALDPAKPVFIDLPLEKRLDRTDANFVMVIHTASGLLGIDEPIGHADFYPNGGKEIQPLCLGMNRLSSLICSHRAAYTYLAESIARPVYVGTKCSSWEKYLAGACRAHERVVMGFDTDNMAEGTFFLKMTRIEPYGFDGDDPDDDVEVDVVPHNSDTEEVLSKYHWYPRSRSLSPLTSAAEYLIILGVSALLLLA